MFDISDEELRLLVNDLEVLEEIPEEVAYRIEETIQQLLMQDNQSFVKANTSPLKSKISWGNLALAASFVLAIGLGANFLTQDGIDGAPTSTIANQGTGAKFEDDEILTSAGAQIATVESAVPVFDSGINYQNSLSREILPFIPKSTYGSITNIDPAIINCIASLGLTETVSLIDTGRYRDINVTAVWSAITPTVWQIAIIDKDCNPVAELNFK